MEGDRSCWDRAGADLTGWRSWRICTAPGDRCERKGSGRWRGRFGDRRGAGCGGRGFAGEEPPEPNGRGAHGVKIDRGQGGDLGLPEDQQADDDNADDVVEAAAAAEEAVDEVGVSEAADHQERGGEDDHGKDPGEAGLQGGREGFGDGEGDDVLRAVKSLEKEDRGDHDAGGARAGEAAEVHVAFDCELGGDN